MEAKLVFNDQSVTTAVSNKEARAWFTNMMEAVADLINEEINGKRICRKVIRSWQLDEACHQWDIESQPTYPMFARPESRKTMTNKKLAHMRQATCPNTARRH
jgi:hypothetical protein